jgi:DNA mismatch endonuclease, patch repair protein
MPKANADYWQPKLRRNRERDRRQTADLEAEGWRVIRLWEHVPVSVAAYAVASVVAPGRSRAL